MKTSPYARRLSLILALTMTCALSMGCITGNSSSSGSTSGTAGSSTTTTTSGTSTVTTVTTSSASTMVTLLDASDQFTNRDLTQTADLSAATYLTVTSGEDIHITQAGVYVLSGTATDVTVYVEAADEDKVQLVLDGVSITNSDMPAIYVLTADKVFVTTTAGSANTLKVTGTFTKGSAVIHSKSDLVLNGLGTLTITSTQGKGIKCSDDLKITGGTYVISSYSHAIDANDSIRICDGTFTITSSNKDGLHAENEDDDSLGYIYICGGTFTITAASDGLEGDAFVVIDGGTFTIKAAEGIEGTYVQINGGTISIVATDDGINASSKSKSYAMTIEINDGDITVNMGSGDTDAIDSNGNLYINGGTLTITAQSPFDYDGVGQLNGGTVIVNGSRVTTLSNQFMGGGQMGGFGRRGSNGWDGNMQAPDMGQPPRVWCPCRRFLCQRLRTPHMWGHHLP